MRTKTRAPAEYKEVPDRCRGENPRDSPYISLHVNLNPLGASIATPGMEDGMRIKYANVPPAPFAIMHVKVGNI